MAKIISNLKVDEVVELFLTTMLEPDYVPSNKNWGICNNFMGQGREALEAAPTPLWLATFGLVNMAEARMDQILITYAQKNKLNHSYPIENDSDAYWTNTHKWEDHWLEKRRALMTKMLAFLKSNDIEDLRNELPAGN